MRAVADARLSEVKERLQATRDYLLASLADPAAMARAPLRDRALAMGIVHDKLALESGKPTQHIAIVTRREVEEMDGLAERLAKALMEQSRRTASNSNDINSLGE